MDLFFVLYRLAPALQYIFKLSYVPQESDFKELTPSQYAAFYRKASENDRKEMSGKKILAFLPDDVNVYNKLIKAEGNDLVIIGEDDYSAFKCASEYIDKCCVESGRKFRTLEDKLIIMAKMLPEVFMEGTPYAIHAKNKNSRRN